MDNLTWQESQRPTGLAITDQPAALASPSGVSRAEREKAHGHGAAVLWLTGLSAAGKTTVAAGALRQLFSLGMHAHLLDGDVLRNGLSADLGFSREDRSEHVRRTAEVARLMAQDGAVVLVALMSPYAQDRAMARAIVGVDFHEVHVATDLETCVERDPKGFYAKINPGTAAGMALISAPYEESQAPELRLDTAQQPIARSVAILVDYVLGYCVFESDAVLRGKALKDAARADAKPGLAAWHP